MNQTINDLKTRRSIRKFKDKQITDEELKTILEAGTYAPTGRGAQSPKIIVIQNPIRLKNFPHGIEVISQLKCLKIWTHSMEGKHCLLF